MPADLTPGAIDALVKRLRDWDITDDDKFLIADALTALHGGQEAMREVLFDCREHFVAIAQAGYPMPADQSGYARRRVEKIDAALRAPPLEAPAPAVDTLRAQIEALHREACRSLAASPDSAFYQGLECGLQRAMMVVRGVGDAPAVDPVAEAARVLLEAMTARPQRADPFDACDPDVERLAIEYAGHGAGDAVIVLETAEKFMIAGLRALAQENRHE